MVQIFNPILNKVHFINQYTLLYILSGTGSIQVDFKNYHNWENKAIYLEKGQYIKFLSDDFSVQKIEFQNREVFENKEVRVLFKHLISLGHIDAIQGSKLEMYLSVANKEQDAKKIIEHSLEQWFLQNPFNASRREYQSIFDVKDLIDKTFPDQVTGKDLQSMVGEKGIDTSCLIKEKLGLTVKSMLEQKRLVESKKKVVFSDCSVQEVCYDVGFKDPAYFTRVFKKRTGCTPIQFRENFDFERKDPFVEHILELVRANHMNERSLEFYAEKMNLSVKALSKKTKDKMNETMGGLIRNELICTSKKMLADEWSVKEISIQLGFEEPNHFSSFFKHYTGINPTSFKTEKVQEMASFL